MKIDGVRDGGRKLLLFKDHYATVRLQYGLWLDLKLLCLCDTKEEAKKRQTIFIKALQAMREMENGEEISLLNIFDGEIEFDVSHINDDIEDEGEDEPFVNRIEFD